MILAVCISKLENSQTRTDINNNTVLSCSSRKQRQWKSHHIFTIYLELTGPDCTENRNQLWPCCVAFDLVSCYFDDLKVAPQLAVAELHGVRRLRPCRQLLHAPVDLLAEPRRQFVRERVRCLSCLRREGPLFHRQVEVCLWFLCWSLKCLNWVRHEVQFYT